MADEHPLYAGVLELLSADLAGVGAVALVEDVLGGDGDVLAGDLVGEEEVEGGRGDYDLCVVHPGRLVLY